MQRLCRAAVFPLRHATRLMTTAAQLNPVENNIRQKLSAEFQPLHMDVINESDQHSLSLDDAETHFKVVLISERFEKQSLVKRHRMVHAALQEELKAGVHALSIIAKTPDQWQQSDKTISQSPACRGSPGL